MMKSFLSVMACLIYASAAAGSANHEIHNHHVDHTRSHRVIHARSHHVSFRGIFFSALTSALQKEDMVAFMLIMQRQIDYLDKEEHIKIPVPQLMDLFRMELDNGSMTPKDFHLLANLFRVAADRLEDDDFIKLVKGAIRQQASNSVLRARSHHLSHTRRVLGDVGEELSALTFALKKGDIHALFLIVQKIDNDLNKKHIKFVSPLFHLFLKNLEDGSLTPKDVHLLAKLLRVAADMLEADKFVKLVNGAFRQQASYGVSPAAYYR